MLKRCSGSWCSIAYAIQSPSWVCCAGWKRYACPVSIPALLRSMAALMDQRSRRRWKPSFSVSRSGACYSIDRKARRRAEMMDGKLLLVSNTKDSSPEEIVARYKSLADIERGFRVPKSELEICPVCHRPPDRIRAHTSICFMALIIHRVIRQRLKQSQSSLSPERALESLRRIQRHRITPVIPVVVVI